MSVVTDNNYSWHFRFRIVQIECNIKLRKCKAQVRRGWRKWWKRDMQCSIKVHFEHPSSTLVPEMLFTKWCEKLNVLPTTIEKKILLITRVHLNQMTIPPPVSVSMQILSRLLPDFSITPVKVQDGCGYGKRNCNLCCHVAQNKYMLAKRDLRQQTEKKPLLGFFPQSITVVVIY